MMDVRPIRTKADYEWALKEIEPYFASEPEPDSPDSDRFDVLATLIEAYENKTVEMPAVTPLDMLRFAIDTLGHTQAELAGILGSRSRASEVLNGKRSLTVDQIRAVAQAWRLPVEALMGDAPAAKRAA